MRPKIKSDDCDRVHGLNSNKNLFKKTKKTYSVQCKEVTLKSIGVSFISKVFSTKKSAVSPIESKSRFSYRCIFS